MSLLRVVLPVHFPRGSVHAAWVMCRQWGVRHLDRDVSLRGVIRLSAMQWSRSQAPTGAETECGTGTWSALELGPGGNLH
jgi:hypothetical protein